jgi:hypothetical protein
VFAFTFTFGGGSVVFVFVVAAAANDIGGVGVRKVKRHAPRYAIFTNCKWHYPSGE